MAIFDMTFVIGSVSSSFVGIICPIGTNPCLSKLGLSLVLMNNCVVRVLGPAVAYDIVPRILDCTFVPCDGSSGIIISHFVVSSGSDAIPNCVTKS